MPLVAAPGVFVQRLPGSQGLPPIVQPLGHDVSPLATPGLVVLHARPIEAAPAGRLPAAVQRSARGGRSRTAPSAAVPFAATPDDDAGDGAAAAAEAVSMADPVITPSATTPSRTLPTVSRLTIRMPDRPLTSAASAATPAALQRATSAAAPGMPAPAVATGMRRAAAPAAPPVVSRKAASPSAAPSPALAAPASSVPRSGLGAPLESLPATARPLGAASARTAVPVVSRSAALPALPAPQSNGRAAVQRPARSSTDHAGHGHDSGAAGPLAAAPSPDAPRLPVLPVSRPGESRPAAAPSLPAVSRATAPESRPTLGARPLQPTVRIQRIADGDGEDDDAAPDALPSPWWAPEPAAGAIPFGGGHDGAGDAPTVSRSVATGWDAASPPAVSGPTLSPRSGPGGGAARPVQRLASLPDMPRARPSMSLPTAGAMTALAATGGVHAHTPTAAHSAGASANVQRITAAPAASGSAGPAAPPPQPVIQREVAPATPTPTPVAQPDAPAAARPTERELEDLAQALFSRIRGRLRSELIHDREAKGLTFDNV